MIPVMTAEEPGLGIWASCNDYGQEHNCVPASPPATADERESWEACLTCADHRATVEKTV